MTQDDANNPTTTTGCCPGTGASGCYAVAAG